MNAVSTRAIQHIPSGQPEHATTQGTGEPRRTDYWVPEHVHLCCTPDGVVFLDLRRDKYLGLGGNSASALSLVVAGWPTRDRESRNPPSLDQACAAAERLVRIGLLTREELKGKSATPVRIEPVSMIPIGEDVVALRPRVRFGHVLAFLNACGYAFLALRLLPLESIVRSAAARKLQNGARPSADEPRDLSELAAIFRRLRPFTYSGKERCLFHALAMIRFFAHYGHFPTWVLGVRTDPFTAHSWVQHESVVFDDSPEEVCFFTPILAI